MPALALPDVHTERRQRNIATFRSRLSDRASCAAALAYRAGVVLSISGVGLDPGGRGQNSCPLRRAWVLTKFCENLIDTYRLLAAQIL